MLSRHRPVVLAGLALMTLALVTGCGKKPIATVNGRPISRERFYNLLERSQGSELLAIMMREELTLQEAEKAKVTPTDADVTKRVEELKKADPSRVQGMTPEEVRRQMLVQLAVRNLAFKDVAKPTEADIKAYFDQHKGDLGTAEQVIAKRGVYRTQADAEVARQSLLKNVDFSVVLDKSIDRPEIRQQGGALPPLERTNNPKMPFGFRTEQGGLPADFLLGKDVAQKLFAMTDHSVTDVIPCPTPQGSFQVIQVQEHRAAKEANFQELHERIAEQLSLERLAQKLKAPQGVDPLAYYQAKMIEKAHAEAKIAVNAPNLAEVPKRADLWPHVPDGGGR